MTNWVCRSLWISDDLPAQFRPLQWQGEEIGDGIVVDWSKHHTAFRKISEAHTLTKEAFLAQMESLLTPLKQAVKEAIQLTDRYSQGSLEDEEYVQEMQRLQPIISTLYRQSTDMDLAPLECYEVYRHFKSLISSADNIVLPFSERGIRHWDTPQRMYLVHQAAEAYGEELVSLEFELNKIR